MNYNRENIIFITYIDNPVKMLIFPNRNSNWLIFLTKIDKITYKNSQIL